MAIPMMIGSILLGHQCWLIVSSWKTGTTLMPFLVGISPSLSSSSPSSSPPPLHWIEPDHLHRPTWYSHAIIICTQPKPKSKFGYYGCYTTTTADFLLLMMKWMEIVADEAYPAVREMAITIAIGLSLTNRAVRSWFRAPWFQEDDDDSFFWAGLNRVWGRVSEYKWE